MVNYLVNYQRPNDSLIRAKMYYSKDFDKVPATFQKYEIIILKQINKIHHFVRVQIFVQ